MILCDDNVNESDISLKMLLCVKNRFSEIDENPAQAGLSVTWMGFSVGAMGVEKGNRRSITSMVQTLLSGRRR